MILYRPVGLEELRLIHRSGMRRFPPRLPEQPIFYPVIHLEYARQIARDWNVKSGSSGGFVIRFDLDDAHAATFQRHVVGSRVHEELWVPAGDLEVFNDRIQGPLEVVDAFFAEGYRGAIGRFGALAGQDAVRQFVLLCSLSEQESVRVVESDRETVDLNQHFWRRHDFAGVGIPTRRRDEILSRLGR